MTLTPHAYKPRESILSLFDPLNSPSTPERNTPSPDSSSDKENNGPGQETVFFNRIYTKAKYDKAHTPRGKLIDFGDVSMSDTEEGNQTDREDMENGDVAMVDVFTDHTSSRPARLPLADIQLETISQPSPTPASEAVEAKSPEWSDEHASQHVSTAAPAGDPLADVINSINLSAMTITDDDGQDVSPTPTPAVETRSSLDMVCSPDAPRINVCPPESDSRVASVVSSPITPAASAPMRRALLTTSAADPRRTSVDLQSSFRMQLQSPEMSFDLLNDKISFLGQDSFWTGGDDDTLDLKKEEAKMLAIAEQFEKFGEDTLDLKKEQAKMLAIAEEFGKLADETIPKVNPMRKTPPKSSQPSSAKNSPKESSTPAAVRPPVFTRPPPGMSMENPFSHTPRTQAEAVPSQKGKE
ncbi:hypothetical protein K474DRAFT_49460 [Panus rudis PR-1116 ss-1]|nr:hypothetical protein K474DRAFT_49460 [Panus rudis PR-1116 ss-1]